MWVLKAASVFSFDPKPLWNNFRDSFDGVEASATETLIHKKISLIGLL
jgi:hypothetical protein